MKAIVVHQYGGPDVLQFEDYPDPVPGAGEVPVQVAASSVNPIDYKRRAGSTKDFYLKFPGLIGVDISGTVVKIGAGVEDFSAGDQVFSSTSANQEVLRHARVGGRSPGASRRTV